jgi:phosphoribosylglycinamide formyltransferase-1
VGKQLPRLAIFASGRGSNARALMEKFADGSIPGTLAVVVSNKPDAGVLRIAQEHGIPTVICASHGVARETHEQDLLRTLSAHNIDHVLLAGYMRVLTPHFFREFRGRVLNIHPSLLPEFKGLNAPEQQWNAGVKIAGATVHLVVEEVDAGPILLQGSIEVRGDEGAEGLADRILHEVEHVIYPRAVRLFLEREARGLGRN